MTTMPLLVAVLATSAAVSMVLADDHGVYLFALNHYNNKMEYLNDDNQVAGYYADIIEAVCAIADRDCKLVVDEYSRCWDTDQNPKGGVGLMSQWYTVCTSWLPTYDRLLTFDFTNEFKQIPHVAVYAPSGSSQDYSDLSGLRVGFLSSWFSDAACLKRYTSQSAYPIAGADVPTDRQTYYANSDELISALENGEVDVIFGPSRPELDAALMKISPDGFANYCAATGSGMMTTKDNPDFIAWWNTAFDTLRDGSGYDEICQNLESKHGSIPGSSAAEVCLGY